MDLRDLEIMPTATLQNGEFKQRPPIKFGKLVTKMVCGRCNCGWMSKMEGAFKRAYGHLVEPGAFDDESAIRDLIEASYEDLARWMIKTAMVVEAATPTLSHRVMPRHFKGLETLDLKTPDIQVYAALNIEAGFGTHLQKGFRGENGGGYPGESFSQG